MFERFSEEARRVVVLAQEEARMLDHNYIGTEHLVLALLRESDTRPGELLTRHGLSRDAAQQAVIEIVGRGARAEAGHIPFTRRAKKVMEDALREAHRLGHSSISTKHLLLALLRHPESVGCRVLSRFADLGVLRAELDRSPESADVPADSGQRQPVPVSVAEILTRLESLQRTVDDLRDLVRRLEERLPPNS